MNQPYKSYDPRTPASSIALLIAAEESFSVFNQPYIKVRLETQSELNLHF